MVKYLFHEALIRFSIMYCVYFISIFQYGLTLKKFSPKDKIITLQLYAKHSSNDISLLSLQSHHFLGVPHQETQKLYQQELNKKIV